MPRRSRHWERTKLLHMHAAVDLSICSDQKWRGFRRCVRKDTFRCNAWDLRSSPSATQEKVCWQTISVQHCITAPGHRSSPWETATSV